MITWISVSSNCGMPSSTPFFGLLTTALVGNTSKSPAGERKTVPLQNRVTPFGEAIAVPDRGLFMGNRGRLHDDQRRLVRQFTSYKAWVACLTEFRGRKRKLMSPGKYTELFFLDEAMALAAGHRPCGTCRRADFNRFKASWLAGNRETGLPPNPNIGLIDNFLHRDRLTENGEKRLFPAACGQLPYGTFVAAPDVNGACLIWRGRLHRWTPGGYEPGQPMEPDRPVQVLTPRSIVHVLAAGYGPVAHSSVASSVTEDASDSEGSRC